MPGGAFRVRFRVKSVREAEGEPGFHWVDLVWSGDGAPSPVLPVSLLLPAEWALRVGNLLELNYLIGLPHGEQQSA